MLKTTPQTIKNRFSEQLYSLSSENRFETLKRYFSKLRKDIEDLSAMSQAIDFKDGMLYNNIDSHRLIPGRYFQYPTETEPIEMNCLERSASFYFAAKELYPQSQPALVYLIEDESIHAVTLLTYQNELYCVDPSFDYFERISLMILSLLIFSAWPE